MPESLTDKLVRYKNALNLFVERIQQDKNILAAVLVGSLTKDTIWRKDGMHLWLIEVDGVTKRLKAEMKKPDVDFVNGLSPVVSIDQKTIGSNPRSTVGTMTDISDYLRMVHARRGSDLPNLQGPALQAGDA